MFTLTQPETTVGSDSACDIVIKDLRVSKRLAHRLIWHALTDLFLPGRRKGAMPNIASLLYRTL
ncbi:FHA domain-containing protein [Chloroflexi bacterium TSY]|nr:FHA domain-containing protein [Chloroflexi bacterium TSY]